ncbi:MAG: ISAs1 family transposase [Caldilineaceae bacterium]|nr:ISAs1 family transposase [Caldilineaceae bacterium]
MPPQDRVDIAGHFAELGDPRQRQNREHKFIDILIITICAAICGADDWVAVEQFGAAKRSWFETILELPSGIPSHDTFWRVFRHLDPERFQACFMNWMASIQSLTAGEIIAVDGKQLRRSQDAAAGKAAIHMVSAWASANRLVLGQRKVDDKSNEITAIPQLLAALDLRGCIVTIDAMGCQTEIAATILDREADYLLALKENHGRLYEDVVLLFDDLEASGFTAYAHDVAKTVDGDHGRIEVREAWTIADPKLIMALRTADKWPQLAALVKVRAQRYLKDKPSVDTRYFIASFPGTAAQLLEGVRTHWAIENSLHWVLDIAFREDECRLRKDNGAQNFAVLRHIALSLLQQDDSLKVGVKNKRLRAGWDQNYLLAILRPLFTLR